MYLFLMFKVYKNFTEFYFLWTEFLNKVVILSFHCANSFKSSITETHKQVHFPDVNFFMQACFFFHKFLRSLVRMLKFHSTVIFFAILKILDRPNK